MRNLHPPSAMGQSERYRAILPRECPFELCGTSHVVLLVNECALVEISMVGNA